MPEKNAVWFSGTSSICKAISAPGLTGAGRITVKRPLEDRNDNDWPSRLTRVTPLEGTGRSNRRSPSDLNLKCNRDFSGSAETISESDLSSRATTAGSRDSLRLCILIQRTGVDEPDLIC